MGTAVIMGAIRACNEPVERDEQTSATDDALEAKSALYEAELALEHEWLGQSSAGRWFGDLPDDDCPW